MDISEYLRFLNIGAIVVPIVVMIALFFGVAIFVRRMGAATAPAGREHWASLGYEPAEGARKTGMFRQSDHQVRRYKGRELHYTSSRKAGFISRFEESWACSLASPARFGLQVVEKNEAPKPGRRKKNKASQTHSYGGSFGRGPLAFAWYSWKQHFSDRLETGDARLDGRFAIFGTDAQAAGALLAKPNVRRALLSLRHVDLSAIGSEVRFDDPFRDNTLLLRGATAEGVAKVHDTIAELIAETAEAVSK